MSDDPVPAAIARSAPAFDHLPATELPPGVLVVPTYRLHKPEHAGWATFFGGPLGGSLVLARNYYRLRDRSAMWAVLALGLLGQLAACGIGYYLAETGTHGGYLPMILACWGMVGIGRMYQGAEIQRHQERGGPLAPAWQPVVMGLASLVVTVAVACAVAVAVFYAQRPSSIDLGDEHEVVYRDGISEPQARAVAKALTDSGYFTPGPAAVELSLHDGRLVLGFVVVGSGHLSHAERNWALHRASDVSAHAWHDEPVDVAVLDGELHQLDLVRWESREKTITVSPTRQVIYRNAIGEAEARALGTLFDAEYSGEWDVYVERDGTRVVLEFVVKDGVWNDPDQKAFYRDLAAQASARVFRHMPVDVVFVDEALTQHGKLAWEGDTTHREP